METINKNKLAKRWKVGYSAITKGIEKRYIRLENNEITMVEVKRHEDIIDTGLYLPYSPFLKYLKTKNLSIDLNAVSNYLTMQTIFVKRWYAGQFRIMKKDAIKALEHFIGQDEESVYNYLLETL